MTGGLELILIMMTVITLKIIIMIAEIMVLTFIFMIGFLKICFCVLTMMEITIMMLIMV